MEFAKYFDHTNLKPDATDEELLKLCIEADGLGCAMVAVNPAWVALCKGRLSGSGVHVGAAISFPLGQSTLDVKLFETENAIKDGADEIDYVINLGKVKMGDWTYVEKEMGLLAAMCHDSQVVCKVIFENCYLTKDEIINLSMIANRVRPDFIKTSTGFGPSGAKAADVKLMRQWAEVQVKAAGGIRTLADCMEMIQAGATRIGTSSTVRIVKEYERMHG